MNPPTTTVVTTENLRHAWHLWQATTEAGEVATYPRDTAHAEFDAWLAAHDREVQARTLEEAADDTNCLDDSELLRDRAAALRTPDAGVGGRS